MAKKETDKEKVQRRTQGIFNKFEYASVLREKFNTIAVKLIREERARCTKEHRNHSERMIEERYKLVKGIQEDHKEQMKKMKKKYEKKIHDMEWIDY